MKKFVPLILVFGYFFSSCASRPPQVIKEVIRDTIFINKKTKQYEAVRMAKLDRFKVSPSYFPAVGQDDRIRHIVLHYTALDNERSLNVLTQQQVSAHYLIPDTFNDSIYLLVDETKRAWHAGLSSWKGINNINYSSIGIEITNPGYTVDIDGDRQFADFNELQIQKAAELIQDLTERYDIKPINIIGHSDVAPQRKHDPGPKFPWKRLYDQYGVGAWYEEAHRNIYLGQFPFGETEDSLFILSVQKDLAKYGYEIQPTGQWDEQTQKVITAFQYHFRPRFTDGIMDAETWAILQALNLKYR